MEVVAIGGLVLHLVPLALVKVPVGHQVRVVQLDGGVVEVATAGARPVEGHGHALHSTALSSSRTDPRIPGNDALSDILWLLSNQQASMCGSMICSITAAYEHRED